MHVLSSRDKKAKCVKKPGRAQCEGCLESGNPCTFRDRARYHADRDARSARQIAPQSAGAATQFHTIVWDEFSGTGQEANASGLTQPSAAEDSAAADSTFASHRSAIGTFIHSKSTLSN